MRNTKSSTKASAPFCDTMLPPVPLLRSPPLPLTLPHHPPPSSETKKTNSAQHTHKIANATSVTRNLLSTSHSPTHLPFPSPATSNNSRKKVSAHRSPHHAAGNVLNARQTSNGTCQRRGIPSRMAMRGCRLSEDFSGIGGGSLVGCGWGGDAWSVGSVGTVAWREARVGTEGRGVGCCYRCFCCMARWEGSCEVGFGAGEGATLGSCRGCACCGRDCWMSIAERPRGEREGLTRIEIRGSPVYPGSARSRKGPTSRHRTRSCLIT